MAEPMCCQWKDTVTRQAARTRRVIRCADAYGDRRSRLAEVHAHARDDLDPALESETHQLVLPLPSCSMRSKRRRISSSRLWRSGSPGLFRMNTVAIAAVMSDRNANPQTAKEISAQRAAGLVRTAPPSP